MFEGGELEYFLWHKVYVINYTCGNVNMFYEKKC